MSERIQLRRTKGGEVQPCGQCGVPGAKGQHGFCSPECRFWSKVTKTETCWLWGGAPHNAKGYGRFDAYGRRWLAHRFAYTLIVGPFPDELELDHTCLNTRCVCPTHLDPITSEVHDNERSDQGAYNRVKTKCPQEHAYTPANTRVDIRGRRHCRACERGRRRAATNSAA